MFARRREGIVRKLAQRRRRRGVHLIHRLQFEVALRRLLIDPKVAGLQQGLALRDREAFLRREHKLDDPGSRAHRTPDCGTLPATPPAGDPAVPILTISNAFKGSAQRAWAAISAQRSGALATRPPSTSTSSLSAWAGK